MPTTFSTRIEWYNHHVRAGSRSLRGTKNPKLPSYGVQHVPPPKVTATRFRTSPLKSARFALLRLRLRVIRRNKANRSLFRGLVTLGVPQVWVSHNVQHVPPAGGGHRAPLGLSNSDGSCAVNASLAALASAVAAGPESAKSSRLLRSAALDGVESAKQEVISKCGVAFQPGITCAREYLRGIVELYPWLAREYAIVDIPTRYDGPVLAATATSSSFPTAAAGGVYFRGPVPGHWIAVTRRVDGLHVVDDSKTTKGLPGPEFALAAVVVRKGEADTFRAPVRESGRCAQTSKKSGNRQCGNSIVPGFDFCPGRAASSESCEVWMCVPGVSPPKPGSATVPFPGPVRRGMIHRR